MRIIPPGNLPKRPHVRIHIKRAKQVWIPYGHQTAGRAMSFCQDALADVWPTRRQVELMRAHEDHWQLDLPSSYCKRCGVSSGPGGTTESGCASCIGTRISWEQIVRLSAYTNPVSRWVTSMKFAHAWSWATWFGQQLADRIDPRPDGGKVAVCPVPMHWARRIRRGYNQAQLMAISLARQRNWPMASLLRRTRYTPPQTTVTPWRRPANIRRSFAIKPVDLTGWHVWLVDDVKTTGATLTACTKLLRRSGATSVSAAVAAVADPPGFGPGDR